MKTEMTEPLEELTTYYEQFNEKVVTQRHEVEGLDRRINDLRLEVAVRPAAYLRSFLGYFTWRSPILQKQTVESPYCTIVWQI
jgi:hypothetical protein